MLASFQNIHRFLMHLPADGIAVCTGGGEEEPQRLPARVAAALGHYVVKGASGLRVKLVEDAGGNVQAVLGRHFTGQHLIDASRWLIHHALGGRDDLDQPAQRRVLPNHIHRHIKHNGRLLTVAGAGINLRLPLIVVDEHVQRQRRAQLALSIFLSNLDIHLIVLPDIGIFFPHRAEHIPDDLLLPG